MRKISDTIARLAAAKARTASSDAVDAPLEPLLDFGSNPGDLNGWTFLPQDVGDELPLVVVLHGCTQTAAGYDNGSGWSQLAQREGFALLYPEQKRGNNPGLCFNWFAPDDTRRDSGEVHSIRQMISALVASGRIDAQRIFVTGLSAGGAMASALLATYPEVFAGGAIIAGLPHGVAKSVPEAFDRMRGHGLPPASALQALLGKASNHDGPWPTISVWHGTNDNTVAYANSHAIVSQWRKVHGAGLQPTGTTTVDGHPNRQWQDHEGRVAIEEISISGMDHGAPLATEGPESLGAPGPFMLDVGTSSTLRIAQSWGIAAGATGQDEEPVRLDGRRVAARKKSATRPDATRQLVRETGDEKAVADNESPLGKIINDALRAAGLMR